MAGGASYQAAQAANLAKAQAYLDQQKASQDAKTQQAYRENAAVTSLRERAPSGLESDSVAAKEVRQEAAQDTSAAYAAGGFQQKGTTQDLFSSQREAALKSGKFDYGSVQSAFYSPPDTFVNNKGQTAQRMTTQQQRVATYKGLSQQQIQQMSRAQANQPQATTQSEADKASLIYGKQSEYGGLGQFGPTSTQPTQSRNVSELISKSYAPEFQTFTSISQKPTDETQTNLSNYQSKGYQSIQISDKKGNVIAKVPISKANEALNKYATSLGEVTYSPTDQISTNPELEQAVLTSLAKNTGGFSGALTGGTSYLNALAAKGVLTSSDFDLINKSVGSFNQQIGIQAANVRQTNIQSAKTQINDITNTLSQAKSSGATSINIIGANGQVLGTVNPQNVSQARLQTLKILSKSGGKAILQYNVATKQTQTETTSTLVTPGFREDPLSLLARPILEFGASIGAQIKEDITRPQRNLLNEIPIIQLLTGKPLTGFGPTATVSQKLEETFGVGQEVEKVKSGQYQGIQQAAALGGIIASVAIPTIAGTNIAAKVPEFTSISSKIRDVNFEAKFGKAYQEKTLEVHKEQLGNTMVFTQGTEESIGLTGLKVEKAQLTKPIKIGEQTYTVRAGQAELPKGISLTKNIEAIGRKGEKVTKQVPNIIDITAQKAKSGQAILPQAYLSKSQVGLVREPTGLPEQKFLVSGKVRPEVKSTLGLEPVPGQKDIFIGTLKTKGQRQYFEAAQKANLLTGRLSEIHVQSRADVSKAPDVYLAVSRNPDLLKGGKFPGIVRPEIIGYHEAYPTKIQEFTKPTKVTRAYKPMKPFEMSKGLRTGAGAQGKAKNILELQKPTSTKLLEKPELFKTTKETGRYELTKGYTPTLTRQRQRQQTELETTFLQYPKSSTISIGLTGNITEEKTKYTTNLDKLFKTSTKERTSTTFKITTIPKSIQTPFTSSLFKQETGTKLVQSQIEKQITKTGNILTPPTIPGEPPGKKKIPPFGFPGFKTGGGFGIFAGRGERKGFIGNVPESSIIGVYKRSEISYGGVSNKSNNKTMRMLKGSKSFKL